MTVRTESHQARVLVETAVVEVVKEEEPNRKGMLSGR
jgi:hypothetical protein